MTWPERGLSTRVLGGLVGGVVGALIGSLLGITVAELELIPSSQIVLVTIGVTLIGVGAGAWRGDPAIRFLLRVIGEWF